MQETVVTGSGTAPKYGIGLAEKAEGVWGHGGQTLGFESDVAFFEEQGLSMVGWGTSANNIMAGGVNAVSGALVNAGVLPDPALAKTEELRAKMAGPEWQLVSVKMASGDGLQPDDPEDYTIRFASSGSFSAQADCNRVLGDWRLARLELAILPGPTTRVACPQGSLSDRFIELISDANFAFFPADDMLVVLSKTGDDVAQLFFRQDE